MAWHGISVSYTVFLDQAKQGVAGEAELGVADCQLQIARRLYSRICRAAKDRKTWPGLAGFGWMALAGLISLPLAWTCQIRLDTDDTTQHVNAVKLSFFAQSPAFR